MVEEFDAAIKFLGGPSGAKNKDQNFITVNTYQTETLKSSTKVNPENVKAEI